MKQLALELASPPPPTLGNFVAGANAEVVAALQAFAAGSERFIYLWGGPGSGRSHLLHAVLGACASAGRTTRLYGNGQLPGTGADAAIVGVDDVHGLDDAAQIALFGLYNRLRDEGGALVATGDRPPARLPLRPDLQTRLAWGLVYEVHPLSEGDRRAALNDYAAARGLGMPGEVADYLLARVPRDLRTLRALVDTLDRASLEQRRALTVPLARTVLQAMQGGKDNQERGIDDSGAV